MPGRGQRIEEISDVLNAVSGRLAGSALDGEDRCE